MTRNDAVRIIRFEQQHQQALAHTAVSKGQRSRRQETANDLAAIAVLVARYFPVEEGAV